VVAAEVSTHEPSRRDPRLLSTAGCSERSIAALARILTQRTRDSLVHIAGSPRVRAGHEVNAGLDGNPGHDYRE
jgi:hypothetical protein